MADDKKKYSEDFDEANAQILVEMLQDPMTSEPVRLQIINEILETTKDTSFFETIFKEDMSKSRCQNCQHENHWLIPEDDLNIFGYVTADKDVRVPRHTTEAECSTYAEACAKKKVTA